MTEKSAADRVLELDEKATKGSWRTPEKGFHILADDQVIGRVELVYDDPNDYLSCPNVTRMAHNQDLIAEYRTLAPALARQVKELEANRDALLQLVRREQTNASGDEFDMLRLIEKEIIQWSQND